MKNQNAYESCCMNEVLGETLRPGGFRLTEKGVQYCNISSGDTVLDLGCGRGATLNYLYEKHNVLATGIDPSEKLIEAAKKNCGYAKILLGKGEQLPFADESFNCVFAECTLSLMDNLDSVLKQVHRVSKENGWFIITDVYARNPQATSGLCNYSINSCMRGLHNLSQLINCLEQVGFSVVHSEDCSELLKELVVKIGFSYGSMSEFWNVASEKCVDGDNFYNALKQCKPGCFLLIARKRGIANG